MCSNTFFLTVRKGTEPSINGSFIERNLYFVQMLNYDVMMTILGGGGGSYGGGGGGSYGGGGGSYGGGGGGYGGGGGRSYGM